MSNNLFFNYMESLNPFTPIEFNCDMCHHSHNKYLPPGTKYTTCARCGNLIDISKLDRRAMRLSSRSRMTNLNTNNRATIITIVNFTYTLIKNNTDTFSC